jgi:ribosomal protein S18 acetylase RimI-like enzyme
MKSEKYSETNLNKMEFEHNSQKLAYSFLEWDSNLLGINVVGIKKIISRRKSIREMLRLFGSSLKKPCLIVFRFGTAYSNLTRILREEGYYKVETLVSFENNLKKKAGNRKAPVRGFRKSDTPFLVSIGKNSFLNSHYYMDKNLSKRKIDLLKAEWIKNDCEGRADYIFVAEDNCEIAGFCFLLRKDNALIIDLIAVSEKHRRKSIGSNLISKAISFSIKKGFKKIIVGTQQHNIPSINFYKENGFNQKKLEYTFHKYLR